MDFGFICLACFFFYRRYVFKSKIIFYINNLFVRLSFESEDNKSFLCLTYELGDDSATPGWRHEIWNSGGHWKSVVIITDDNALWRWSLAAVSFRRLASSKVTAAPWIVIRQRGRSLASSSNSLDLSLHPWRFSFTHCTACLDGLDFTCRVGALCTADVLAPPCGWHALPIEYYMWKSTRRKWHSNRPCESCREEFKTGHSSVRSVSRNSDSAS